MRSKSCPQALDLCSCLRKTLNETVLRGSSSDFVGKLEKSSTSEINAQQGTMTTVSWDIGAELLCAPTECNAAAVSITRLSASCLGTV